MASGQEPKIRLELELATDQPELLEGLDQWLKLGLVNDEQVFHLCRETLSCKLTPVPQSKPAESPAPEATSADFSPLSNPSVLTNPFDDAREALAAESSSAADFLPDSEDPESSSEALPAGQTGGAFSSRSPSNTQPNASPLGQDSLTPSRPVARWLNRLMSELSVVWLLGLGVFLVVLSSAVLAATQWAKFNAVGQYLVLLAYTLVFWGIGLWSSRNEHLQLTSRTLQMITLLLVPLNFWAMDGLGVWTSGGGFLVVAVAAVALTLAALQVMRNQQTPTIKQANALGLSFLHFGWSLSLVPVLAVYVGTVGSAIATLLTRNTGTDPPSTLRPSRWSTLAVFFALGLLLIRGLSVLSENNWGKLGLAFGLYGATWVWVGQKRLGQSQEVSSDSFSLRSAPEGSIWLGRALLWWGWLISIEDFRFQAFGVSFLGLALRLQALQKLGRRRDLLVGYAIAVQLAFVGWQLIPSSIREAIMAPLSAWATTRGGEDFALLGLSLFPYVIAMVALADWYLRQEQTKLGRFTDGIALGSNLLLTLFSLFSHPVLVVHLIASTITALIGAWRRTPTRRWRIFLCNGLSLITLIVTIDYLWPNLSETRWIGVMTVLAMLWLVLSKGLPQSWGGTAGLYGYGLSGLSYFLLWNHLIDADFQSSLGWIGFLIPLTLTLIGRHRASIVTTGIAIPLTLAIPWTRLVGLGTATGLTLANSSLYRRRWVALMATALGLGFVVCIWEDLVPNYPNDAADWCVVTVGLIAGLWMIWRWLPVPNEEEPSDQVIPTYKDAADTWGHLLAVGLLVFISLVLGFLYSGSGDPKVPYVIAQASFLVVLGLRYWGQVQSTTVYLAGWGVELLVAQMLAWQEPSTVNLAVPTLGLGLVALILSAVLRRSQPSLVAPLHTLTLAYAVLALAFRSTTATAWTGWLVVGAALLLLEVGRRKQQAGLRWLALLGLSLGWYELVIYQLLQSAGGSPVDGVIVLAGVAALIMAVYRLAANRLDRNLRLPQSDLVWAAHIHWLIGSVLMLGVGIALPFGDVDLDWVGLAIATVLLLYALLQGSIGDQSALKSAWVYAGLVELVGWFAFLRFTVPPLQILDNWWGAVACAVAVPIYWIPWSHRGWPQRPWRMMAVGAPLAITLLTEGFDHIPTLWILAGFYGWLAWHSRRIQISYLSAACIVWAIWVWLEQQNMQDTLAFVLPLGIALLYIAQVDPHLSRPDSRGSRHWLRLIAISVILLTALFTDRWTGLPVGIMALGAIAAGLFFRTRAFLYSGTAVFVLNALNQLILLNAEYPFIKWIAGILVGIALIWIAADFERRRDQWLMLTQNWMQDLDGWQ